MADQASEGLLSPWLRNKRIDACKCYLEGRILDYGCGSGELARLIDEKMYVGVDIDEDSLSIAQNKFPNHTFYSQLPNNIGTFDTIVSLAVIEHVSSPHDFLIYLRQYLSEKDTSRIVITTPHPSVDWIHTTGSILGLFSKHASDEHEELLGYRDIKKEGEKASLRLVRYNRFLFFANQLAIYQRME